jgi:hypothetical protein
MKRKPYSKPEVVLLWSDELKGKHPANHESTSIASAGTRNLLAPQSRFTASHYPHPTSSRPTIS